LYKNFKTHKIKDHSDMFRIVCDPSSGYQVVLDRPSYRTHTPVVHKSRCQTPIKHTTNISEPLRISVKYSSIFSDDGSHTIRNMSEWSLILCLLKFLFNVDF